MKKLSSYLLLIFFSFLVSSHADDIKEFEIEGISIGDSLLSYMSVQKIKSGIKDTRYMYDYINFDYGEVYLYEGIQNYEYMSFFVKPNDEKFLIYELRGVISYIENLNGCLKQRDEIAKEISEIFKNAKKSKQSFKARGDPSGKSTQNKILFTFNSGDEIQLVCSDWEESLRIKNNWGEGLSVIISTNGVLNWLRGL
tara:strand:- start:91 stop:681 length:591 start_codon:yes stop_codon:yes gene_type:complete